MPKNFWKALIERKLVTEYNKVLGFLDSVEFAAHNKYKQTF